MASSARTVTVNIVGDASGLNRSLTGASDTAKTTGSRISDAFKGAFGVIANESNGAFGPLLGIMGSMGPALDGLSDKSAKFGEKMAGIGAGMAGVGMAASLLGSADVAAENQLKTAITNTGGTWDQYKDQVDAVIKAGAKYGDTSNQTMNALQTLTTATGSAGKATADFGVVANLAAARHESLTEAATAYAKILAGTGTKTLSQFGITTTEVAAKVAASNGTMTKGQAAASLLAAAIKGQAAAASDTFKGKLDHLRASVENMVAGLATKLGPSLQVVGLGMTAAGSAISIASAISEHFKQTTVELTDAQKAQQVAQEAATATAAESTVATDAEATSAALETTALTAEDAGWTITDALEAIGLAPILAIIAAVALLGIGIYELATHWSKVWTGIKDVAVNVWHGIQSGFIQPIEGFFQAIPAFVQSHWQLLLAILTGPVGLAVLFIKDHFNGIKTFFANFPSDMASIAVHMWDWIGETFKAALDGIIGLWNGLHIPSMGISVMGHHIGTPQINVPQIPMLAAGGIVTGPTLAMLGEAGNEAVLPLPASGMGGLGGQDINLNLAVQVDGATIAQIVRTKLLQTTARNATRVGLG